MDWYVEFCQFERKSSWIEEQEDESGDEETEVILEPGFEIEKIGTREAGETKLHIFKIEKYKSIFEIEMRWVFDP